MVTQTFKNLPSPFASGWLKRYYFTRFAFSAAWVVLAFSVAPSKPTLAAIMLIGYPAWDAVANYIDAQRSGGLGQNRSQLFNIIVSFLTTIAVVVALGSSLNNVLVVFGIWAGFSGILQLATAVGRWKSVGAQWVMILSGTQSAVAGVAMIVMAYGPNPVGIVSVAPYAAFGAFYFALSAIWLTISDARKGNLRTAS